MKSNQKKKAKKANQMGTKEMHGHRNSALQIPLDFDKAIEGLLNVKPSGAKPAKLKK